MKVWTLQGNLVDARIIRSGFSSAAARRIARESVAAMKESK